MSQKQVCGSGGFMWSRETTTTLISLYEQNPALYKVKSANYHNKNTRQTALQQIAKEINENHMTNLTVADVAKKIHGLRTNYFQEVNKIKKSEKSGAATDEIYIPKWWCFELLHFLRDHSVVVFEGSSNMPSAAAAVESEEEVGDSEEIVFEGTISDLETSPPFSPASAGSSRGPTRPSSRESINQPPTKKQKRNDADIGTLLSTATSALEKIYDRRGTTNNHTIFGQMIASEMENITNADILDTFKEEVMASLFRAKRRQREEK